MPNTRLTDSQLLERLSNILSNELQTTDLTYNVAGPAAGKIATMKEYPSDSVSGDRCKLTTYTYDGSGELIKIAETYGTI